MKPARSLFLPSAFTKLPLTNSGTLSAVGGWGHRRGSSVPQLLARSGVGTAVQTAPSPGNAGKSSFKEAAGKFVCRNSSRTGLHREHAGASIPCTVLGPDCARGLATLRGHLCLMGEVLEPGNVHVHCCRGRWSSPKEPHSPPTA